MRRIILVTPYASTEVLTKNYLDGEIVGMDEGINIALSSGCKLSLAISSFRKVSLEEILNYIPKDKVMKYVDEGNEKDLQKVVDFLFGQGVEEIVILDSLGNKLVHVHELLQVLKNGKGNIFLHDQYNYVSYFGEGTHVITKQGYDKFSIYGFPEADVSLEHVSKPIRNKHLSFTDSEGLENSILERVAVLKVIQGGVLLALSNND